MKKHAAVLKELVDRESKGKLINAAYQAYRAGEGFTGVVDAVLATLAKRT